MTDIKAKLTYTVADCDMLLVPRLTRLPDGQLIPPRYYRMSEEQAEVVRSFLKAGKPVLACLGPTNESPGLRSPPQMGPPGADDFERVLSEVGFHLGPQTVLFNSDAREFSERRGEDDFERSDARLEVPALDFDTPAREGYPRLRADRVEEEENPLRRGLRVMAHSVESGFDLRLRFPRPVYFEPKGKKLDYDATSLLTATGWNDRQPFLTLEPPAALHLAQARRPRPWQAGRTEARVVPGRRRRRGGDTGELGRAGRTEGAGSGDRPGQPVQRAATVAGPGTAVPADGQLAAGTRRLPAARRA